MRAVPTAELIVPGDTERIDGRRWSTIAPAGAILPLAAHRLLEFLAMQIEAAPWGEIALHTLPPAAMTVAALLLWRFCPPIPGEGARAPAGHSLSIAAGLLLGTLAAVANLLSMLAGSAGSGSVATGISPGAVALVLHVALLAPIAEEIAFRGLIYRHLRRAMVPWVAMLLSAAIFSVMHGSFGQSLWAFLLGLVAAFAYEQTRSIVTPMLIHGLFNAVPIGVAVVRSKPDDVGPVWLVLSVVAVVFTFAARGAASSRR
jgi:membrane protease YdiL (CAAX protease family)